MREFLTSLPNLPDALCAKLALEGVDPDFWHPEDDRIAAANAKTYRKMCGECPEMEKCLTYALDNDIREGIWGGKTPMERRVILRGITGVTSARRTHTVVTQLLADKWELSDACDYVGITIAEFEELRRHYLKNWITYGKGK